MERAEGIEPSSSAWKAEDQPLAQARMKIAKWSPREEFNPRFSVRSRAVYALAYAATDGAPGWSRTSYARVAAECLAVRPPMHGLKWSPRGELNPQPSAYKAVALPVELPRLWWARRGSNSRPPRCHRDALPLSYRPGGGLRARTADLAASLR